VRFFIAENCHFFSVSLRHYFSLTQVNFKPFLMGSSKKKLTFCVFLVMCALSSISGYSQNPFSFTPPSLVEASPEAYSLGKYGNNPVNKYNGIPEIALPVYEMSFEGINIPISLSYRMPGLNPKEEASSVGLGWSLLSSAVITRSVSDKDDFLIGSSGYWGWIYSEPFVPKDHDANIYGVSSEMIVPHQSQYELSTLDGNDSPDLQPDVFTVSLFGKSLRFVLNKDAYIPPLSAAQRPNEISVTVLNEKNHVVKFYRDNMSFKITDDKGIIYEFTVNSKSNLKGDLPYGVYGQISAWYLTKVIAPSGKFISFLYDKSVSVQSIESTITNEKKIYNVNGAGITSLYTSTLGFTVSKNEIFKTYSQAEEVYITQISTGNEAIYFNYQFDREDLNACDAADNCYGLSHTLSKKAGRLNSIDIYFRLNIGTPKTKTVQFYTSYFDQQYLNDANKSKYLRLKLDAIQIDGKRYSFDYNQISSLPNKETLSIDNWGYYNGKTQTVLHPPFTINESSNYPSGGVSPVVGVKREPDPSFSAIGMLSKIIYPTKGETQYEYEANVVSLRDDLIYPWEDNPSMEPAGEFRNKTIGGLRIKSITNNGAYNSLNEKKEFIYTNPQSANSSGLLVDDALSFISKRILSVGTDNHPSYGDTWFVVRYFTVSSIPISPQYNSAKGHHVGYAYVKENFLTVGYSNAQNGSILSKYFNRANINKWYSSGDKSNSETCNASCFSQVCESISLRDFYNGHSGWELPGYVFNSENGSLLTETYFDNSGNRVKENVYTYELLRNGKVIGVKAELGVACWSEIHDGIGRPIDIFQNYRLDVQTYNLKTSTEKFFKSTDSLTRNCLYDYNGSWLRAKETIIESNNKTTDVSIYYPSDYSSLAQLKQKNILSIPVKVEKRSNNQLIDGKVIEYNDYGMPLSSYRYESSQLLSTTHDPNTIVPLNYSKAFDLVYYPNTIKVKEVVAANGITTTYIWGYGGKYVVAEIVGATYQQIYALYAFDQSKLEAGDDSEGRAIELANLDAAVKNAGLQITIYTHEPLVGIKSKVDPSGIYRGFYYDEFGRLSRIINNQGNVLKMYEYSVGNH
jgi:YD repeat-containing protein